MNKLIQEKHLRPLLILQPTNMYQKNPQSLGRGFSQLLASDIICRQFNQWEFQLSDPLGPLLFFRPTRSPDSLKIWVFHGVSLNGGTPKAPQNDHF